MLKMKDKKILTILCTKILFILTYIVDVGYNGIAPTTGFINNVLNTYLNTYIPRALLVNDQLVRGGYEETFIWTTHPWIIYMFMNCPQNFTLSGVTLKVSGIIYRSSQATRTYFTICHKILISKYYKFISCLCVE